MTLEQRFGKLAHDGIAVIPWNGQHWITEGHVARATSKRLKPRSNFEGFGLEAVTKSFAERVAPHISGWRSWTLVIRKIVRRKNDYSYRPWVLECHHPRGTGVFYLDSRFVSLLPRGVRLRVSRNDIGREEPMHPIVATVGSGKAERCVGLLMALRSHAVYFPEQRDGAKERA